MSAGYLLDTNVISETSRPRPEPRVVGMLRGLSPDSLHLSALTVGELRRGAAKKRARDLAAGAALDAWVDRIEAAYGERILPVTVDIARLWGHWSAGRSRPIVDTLLAATAAAHDLTLVSRNTEDFAGLAVEIIDPWAP